MEAFIAILGHDNIMNHSFKFTRSETSNFFVKLESSSYYTFHRQKNHNFRYEKCNKETSQLERSKTTGIETLQPLEK